MRKAKILFLSVATCMFVACGGSETDEATETDSTIADESTPPIEEETTATSEDVVVEETINEGGKTEDGKTSASKPGSIDQMDPEMVVEGIFLAAESGNYAGLDGICAEDADGDCKSICSIATADAKKKAEFKSYFATGVVTNTEVNGASATVEFKFGPDGKKAEKMQLAKINGKWFIQSF